jgi:uncharacterized membrane protein
MLARVDRGFAGVLLGFFLGPVGLIIAWVMRANALRDQDERERRDRPTRHEDSRPLTAQLDELVSRRARGEITDDEYQRRKHELSNQPMPIRTKPFDQITAADVLSLMERQVREDRTLDYKGELRLDDSGKLDLLQDVVAMANASGGTIVYGAVEGTDEDRGRIAEIRPMSLAPDQLELQISNLLRDNVDERIANIEHRAIEFGKGYLYVIRIPASPRAPHMVTLPSRRPRFTCERQPRTTR